MAKDKAAPTSRGQNDIASFFGGGTAKSKAQPKPKAKPVTVDDSDFDMKEDEQAGSEEISDVEMGVVSEEEVVAPKKKNRAKPKAPATKKRATGDDDAEDDAEEGAGGSNSWQANEPPIHNLSEIFADIVKREPRFKDVAERVRGRKLRVATMCSGTESPLLALDMMCHFVEKQHDVPLEIEHVFSCEIEPFKQAYIERNFQPPLLFRDVCELGQSHATTAYGASAPVPGDVDLLVAGTSCVDYSNLNNEKQGFEAKGESGQTFRGMLSWVTNHRPPIVILENVKGAPWRNVVGAFEDVGYSAESCYLDTKKYYIPHTRQRGYLIAVNKKGSSIPDKWKSLVADLSRPASSTLDAFLLPTDDPRIHQAREKLAREAYNSGDRKTGRTDWAKCQQRHERERANGQLGLKRPLTNWEDGGSCKVYDFAWQDWASGQVERVWDLMDISILQAAKEGRDPLYKTQVWNLSQNVDRNIAAKLGLCPCLTPSMIPFITNRGGPMIGLEALSLQGLPIDRLLLTRETEDNLADLAGNAMSTTVVGTTILAALVLSLGLLRAGDDTETYEVKNPKRTKIVEVEVDEMSVDVTSLSTESLEDHISGEDKLVTKPLTHEISAECTLPDILDGASRSARLCECEGRAGMTDRPLRRCKSCDSSSCIKCGGRPEHDTEPLDVSSVHRFSPLEFHKQLKTKLPMCLLIDGISAESLESARNESKSPVPDKRWEKWRDAVLRATQHELPFVELKRQEVWTAIYESDTARAELSLHSRQPEWRLFAKPEPTEKVHSEIRRWLEKPVARLQCEESILMGKIDLALPITLAAQVRIQGIDELVPAWEARLGLQGDEFKTLQSWSSLQITLEDPDNSPFDRNIEGKYVWLDKCGTANSALHKRIPRDEETHLPPLFLLLDPLRTGPPDADSFVISVDMRRYQYGEKRPTIATLDSSWRQSSKSEFTSVSCEAPCQWVHAPDVSLKASSPTGATYSSPSDRLDVDATQRACSTATAVLRCQVPLPAHMRSIWPSDAWDEISKIRERETFRQLAWLFESIPPIGETFGTWQDVALPEDYCRCETCAPTEPSFQWAVGKGTKMVAVENTAEAGEYERRLKQRPTPFVTQLKLNGDIGTMRIGVNLPSLLHRTLTRLPTRDDTTAPRLSWRLDTQYVPKVSMETPKFRLISNKDDPHHDQPPKFQLDLRPEQCRSLHWMLQRESVDSKPFTEEEISEAMLDPLGWRVEARAQRDVRVRGGVLADQVGYGKTAITLGVIDCTLQAVRKEFEDRPDIPGKIATRATLIVVPPHLMKQWPGEVKKFIKRKLTIVKLGTQTDLNRVSVQDIINADIVFVASNIYQSNVYLENLVAMSAGGDLPATEGRYFNSRLDTILESLGQQVDRLRDEGPKAVMQEIKAGRLRWEEEKANQHLGTKRLKGKNYRDAQEVPVSAAAPEDGSADEQPAKKMSRPSGKIAEVVITRRFPLPSAAESSEEEPIVKSSMSRPSRPSRRRAPSSSKAIEISDDEGGGQDSDYKGSPPPPSDVVDDATSPDDDDEDSDDEEDIKPARKRKGGAKQRPSAAKRRKIVASDDDDVVDDDESSDVSVPSKKRKATGGKPKPPKHSPVTKTQKQTKVKKETKPKKLREHADPWKLKNTDANDWTDVLCPPLEMFHFARKVIDEYTYLTGRALSMVTKISADRHWVLSGTPPTHNFAAIKFIAQFLNLHLGVDDERDGHEKSQEMKKRRGEQTAVEKFHSFREVHSSEWHENRHNIGQNFLDEFVRQNIAEIDEIPSSEEIVDVNLPAAERAIYLELEHHLRALDMTIKRSKKSESDREKRLQKALGDSASAEEALLKRCSHFDLEQALDRENAMSACEVIVTERNGQLKECEVELCKTLEDAVRLEKGLDKVLAQESHFPEYVRTSRDDAVGDSDAKDRVLVLFEEAGIDVSKPLKTITNQQKSKGKGKDEKRSSSAEDRKWELREKTHDLRRLTKELTGRVRSLRYFTLVRDIQKSQGSWTLDKCPNCDKTSLSAEQVAVLSSCGHAGCEECVYAAADKEECICRGDGCQASARRIYVIKGDTLGIDDQRDGHGKHFGKKLETMIDLIKKHIPKDERILVFVQFPDLMQKVNEALTAHKLKFLEIKGTAHTKSGNLQKFQDVITGSDSARILLLNVMDESASGANLTSANHAIFLSPLLTPSQEIYDACETQAIGRLRRYGQQKHVHVYRLLTKDTIDARVYKERAVDRK